MTCLLCLIMKDKSSAEIANDFNTYFANIGKNLSSQIDQDAANADYKSYLTSHTEEKKLNLKVFLQITL